jgi:4-hydroxy-tetrahydrodipicolinate synthase
MSQLRGVLVPMVTCTDSAGKVNEEQQRKLTSFLIENGVHGLMPTASNGECPNFTAEERKTIWQIVIDEAKERVPIAPCTTANTTEETLALSKFAESIGAAAVLISPPFYYGGEMTNAELKEFYKDVAREMKIPIVLYNDPTVTGADLTPELVVELARNRQIDYIKDSSYDPTRVYQMLSDVPAKFQIFVGGCGSALAAFALGAKGWVTGPQNFMPKIAVDLYETCVEKGDFVKGKQLFYERILPVCNFLSSVGKFVAVAKAGTSLLEIEAGEPKRPLLPLTSDEKDALKKILEKTGVIS